MNFILKSIFISRRGKKDRMMYFKGTYDLNITMRKAFWLISQIICFEGLNLEKQFTWNNK